MSQPRILSLYANAADGLTRTVADVFVLVLRIYIGLVFFRSALVKLNDWDSTVYLFVEEYKVPLLPPDVAALLGTAVEFAMPLLLFVGLATRLAALPLMALTCVIQFVLGAANPAYNLTEHFYWLFLLGAIVVYGPGKFSADYLVAKKFALHNI